MLEALGACCAAAPARAAPPPPPLRARVLAAARRGTATKGVPIQLSAADDTPADAAAQWSALCAAFRRPDTSLIYHGRNHYALIFALREREGADGVVRELLTARRGQRPAAWLPWAEARAALLAWSGYAILSLERA